MLVDMSLRRDELPRGALRLRAASICQLLRNDICSPDNIFRMMCERCACIICSVCGTIWPVPLKDLAYIAKMLHCIQNGNDEKLYTMY